MDCLDITLPVDPPVVNEDLLNFAATDLEAGRQLTLGIVHELNNVLGGIAVLSEIYQSSAPGDDGLGEGLALIHKSTGRLQTLVSHLKILNGPPDGEPSYLNLTETVRNLFEMFAPILPKTLKVETTFPLEELAVHLDEALLRHVLLNLALNLRDGVGTRPDASKTLHIIIRHHAGFAELVLSTDGPGEPGETLLSAAAQARVSDAQRRLRAVGGTVSAYSSGRFVLELPLAA